MFSDETMTRLPEICLDELPAARSIRQAAFENWLTGIYHPKSAVEHLAVRDLASARLDQAEAEHRYQLRLEYEATVAPKEFDQRVLDEYFKLERMLRKDVHAGFALFSRNLHGARAFARHWEALAYDTGPDGSGPSLERVIMAMLARKQPWKAQELTDEGWQIMGQALAVSSFSDELIADWLKRSGLRQSSAVGEQIRNRMKGFTDTVKARQELHSLATTEAATWARVAHEIQIELEKQRRLYEQMVMGVGEKGFTGAMRTARAILKFHNDQVQKREKQLISLRKERFKAENKVKKPVGQRPELKETASAQQSPTHSLAGITLPAPVKAAFIQKRTHRPGQPEKSKNQNHAPKPEMQLAGRR